jgi:hypothetical protein
MSNNIELISKKSQFEMALITSHDATGLKGISFPVQVLNANERVKIWLDPDEAVMTFNRLDRMGSQKPLWLNYLG